jgi:hypothetical protein
MAMTLKEAVEQPVEAFLAWARERQAEVVGMPGEPGGPGTWADWECPGASFLADLVGQPVQVQYRLVGVPGTVPLDERRPNDSPEWVGAWEPTPAWLRAFMQAADEHDGPISGDMALTLWEIALERDAGGVC